MFFCFALLLHGVSVSGLCYGGYSALVLRLVCCDVFDLVVLLCLGLRGLLVFVFAVFGVSCLLCVGCV